MSWHSSSRHEDRAGQYRLPYVSFPLPGAVGRRRVATQSVLRSAENAELKSDTRTIITLQVEPKISQRALQSTVLLSLHVCVVIEVSLLCGSVSADTSAASPDALLTLPYIPVATKSPAVTSKNRDHPCGGGRAHPRGYRTGYVNGSCRLILLRVLPERVLHQHRG